MNNKIAKWVPTKEQNSGIITSTYTYIKNNLQILQEETKCPDTFIYQFMGEIQSQYHPNSCRSKAKEFKDKIINK